MSPFIIYLLKANGLLVFFWLFYRLFLRKETFYTAIRWYFTGAVLLSLSIPLLTYTKTVIITQEPVFYEIITGNFATEQAYEPSFWETIDGQKVISYLVICISLFFLTKSVVRIIRLYKTIKRLPALDNTNIRISSGSHTVYSFYRWIVVPENAVHRADTPMILDHENVHLNQKHTLDLIFIELVAAVFWFNPLIKMLQKDINTNLEFIVDEEMIQKHERTLYQKSLLYVQNPQVPAFTNSFNTSDLKKRILQINTQKSKKMKKLKFLLTAPILAAFFALFQVETVAQIQTMEVEEISDEKETSYIVKENFTKDDFQKLTKKLKDDFDIDFIVRNVNYKNKKINSLDYTIRNKDYKISSSVSSLEKNIDPFIIVVNLKESKPFKVEKYPEKAKYSYTVDNNIDPDFEITGQEWKDKSWIEKVSKNQTVVYIIDGGQSSETEVRRLSPDEIFSINVHKDKETRKKYSGNADNVVIIKTKKQIKDINQFTFNADILREDRKVFDEVAERYPIVIDNGLMTKEQLKEFDNSKIQSMRINLDMTEKKQSTIVYLYTKPTSYTSLDLKEIYINGNKATEEELRKHIEKENSKAINNTERENISILESIKINGKETTLDNLMNEDERIRKEGIQNRTFEFKFAPISEQNIVYILNGKEVSYDEFQKTHPDDIESVNVSKDQKTTEKYGERAKDGVIEVTTKSQKEVSLNQKINELKARELAIQKRQKVVEIRTKKLAHLKKEQEKRKQQLVTKRNEIIEKSTQRRKELEQHHQELTEQRKEIRDRVEQRRKELEKSRQEREKWVANFASAFDEG